jgi:hypothetical protein
MRANGYAAWSEGHEMPFWQVMSDGSRAVALGVYERYGNESSQVAVSAAFATRDSFLGGLRETKGLRRTSSHTGQSQQREVCARQFDRPATVMIET